MLNINAINDNDISRGLNNWVLSDFNAMKSITEKFTKGEITFK